MMGFEKSGKPENIDKNYSDNTSQALNKILVEQKIVDQLFALINSEPCSEILFSEALSLLLTHPLLSTIKICLWKRKGNINNAILSNKPDHCFIKDLASLNYPEYDESQKVIVNTDKPETTIPTDEDLVNIFFNLNSEGFYCASFWLYNARKILQDSRDFLCRFFNLLELYLSSLKLKQQQRLLNSILENAQQSIEITDINAVIEYVNPAFNEITGYSKNEAVGKTVASLLRANEASPIIFADIKKKLLKGQVWKGKFISRKKNGENWTAQSIIIPIKDSTGKIIQNVAIKQDISNLVEQLHKTEKSQERYVQIMDAVSDAIIIHDIHGKIIQTNTMACIKLGYNHEELKHLNIFDLEIELSQSSLKKILESMDAEPITLEGRYRHKDGSSFPVEVRLSLSNIAHQKLYIAVARDISLRKQQEAEIQQLASALEQSPIPMLIADKFGQIIFSSNQMNKLTSYTKTELEGKNISILHTMNNHDYHQIWKTLASNKNWQGEILNVNKYGRPIWVSVIVSPLKNNFGTTTHYLVVMEDISRQKNERMMLVHKANHDQMTNLPNNLSGRYRLEQSIMAAKELEEKVAILFIDLDRFKPVNDLYGHHIGDLILKEFSRILLSSIRSKDFVARHGGDEFIVILNNIKNSENACKIAQKLIDSLTKPILADKNKIEISASIGIALFPEHAISAAELIKKADKAMYFAKKNHSHIKIYDINMDHEDITKTNLRPQFNKAIHKHLFKLYYQPIMELHSGKIIAAEALLRWDSEWSGQISPEKILDLAKESGQLDEIEQWIINSACIEAKRIQRIFDGNFHIHVNITAHQLMNENLIKIVKQALNHSCLEPKRLVFEFKEDILFEYPVLALNQMEKLVQLGVRCCIDRFCMALSSMNYIKSLPFHCIKIDKSITNNIEHNKSNQEMLNNSIKMAKDMNIEVIADGIEEEYQLKLFENLGCRRAQGWYIGDAMPSDKFIEWVRKRNPDLNS